MRDDLRQGFSDDSIDSDIQCTIDFLQDNEMVNHKVGIVGFCLGGRVSMQSAIRANGLSAAAVFYGGNMFPMEASAEAFSASAEAINLQIPIVGFFGTEDQNPSIQQVQELEGILNKSKKDCKFHYYEKAGHGFFCNERNSYVPAAAEDAWVKTLDFFQIHCPL